MHAWAAAFLTNGPNGLQPAAKEAVRFISEQMRADAQHYQVQGVELSTTLLVAVVDDVPGQGQTRRAVVFGVGDSPAYLIRGGRFERLQGQRADEGPVTDTTTDALPDNVNSVFAASLELAPGQMLMLCTDGLGNVIQPVSNKHVRDQLLAWWQNVPTTLEFGWQVSFRAKSYGDDRTVICIWNP